MKKPKFSSGFYNLKFSFIEFLTNNKTKIIVCCMFCLIGILTGIFTAVKLQSAGDTDILESFNVIYKIEDFENFSANFFSRLLSYLLVSVLLLVFSLNPFLSLFGWCLLAYRSFLISLNCVSFIFIFSFNGILKSILIIFPCQLLMIVTLMIFFCYMCNVFYQNKKYGCGKGNNVIMPILICNIILTVLNLVETLLLFIFRSNVILVI